VSVSLCVCLSLLVEKVSLRLLVLSFWNIIKFFFLYVKSVWKREQGSSNWFQLCNFCLFLLWNVW
jgi:hypothetical protein